jgi:hypothetical protein
MIVYDQNALRARARTALASGTIIGSSGGFHRSNLAARLVPVCSYWDMLVLLTIKFTAVPTAASRPKLSAGS